MGANKTYQQTGNRGRMLGESADFRRLRHAVEKSAGDRERAIRNVCRLYGVKTLDALPPGVRATALAPLGPHASTPRT
jgi:hypothetical protein